MHLRFLITAGPTREHLDPVRFLSNRSTGKMGFAIAQAAAEAGHDVILIAGPVSLPTPEGVTRIDIVSARDLLKAVEEELPRADVLVMSAAVADWRPRDIADNKLKKGTMAPVLHLVPNPDILRTIAPLKGERTLIGFAAETGDPVPEARRKLTAKGLDLVIANDVSRPDSGFAVDTNRVTLVSPREATPLPLLPKLEVARRIVEWAEKARS